MYLYHPEYSDHSAHIYARARVALDAWRELLAEGATAETHPAEFQHAVDTAHARLSADLRSRAL